jgi:hypothetical protein
MDHQQAMEHPPGVQSGLTRSSWNQAGGESGPCLAWGRSEMLAENINRNNCQEVNTSLLSSGRLSLEAIYLPAGTVVNNISFWSATTAANTPTNQLFGLFDQNRNLLQSTSNNTTTAWASNSLKTLALTSSYTTTYSGLHYLGIMVTATTVPTIKGFTASTGGQLANAAPA